MNIKQKVDNKPIARIGLVGTGFIAKGFTLFLENQADLKITRVLTRRDPFTIMDFPRREILTKSLQELIDHSDVVVEVSGDVIHAANVIDQVLKAGLPVVTMNAEFHVTCGSYFKTKGLLTEAEGDQPGSLAALSEEALTMGFRPLVYGNVKGFYDPNPKLDDMKLWSKKQGISLPMVIAATDGTKLQFEQALVANGLGATIAVDGMHGWRSEDLVDSAYKLAEEAARLNLAISDYILSDGKMETRIFIVAKHDTPQKKYLSYYKLGDGPYYILSRNRILCHLEIVKTIRQVLRGDGVLIDNGDLPKISVAAIAKRKLRKEEKLDYGAGSCELRGSAVKSIDHPDHIPIGLVYDAVIVRDIAQGQMLSFDDVDIPESLALQAYQTLRQNSYE